MTLKTLSVVALGGLLTACASTPNTYQFDNSRDINASFDKTWESVISYFAENNIPIATVEKDSGLIVATNERLRDETLEKFADCGKGSLNAQSASADVNVFVRRKADDLTSVQVNTLFSQTATGLYNIVSVLECNSNGSLEKALLDKIESDT